MVKGNPRKSTNLILNYFPKNYFLPLILFIAVFFLLPVLYIGSIRQHSVSSVRVSGLTKLENNNNNNKNENPLAVQLEMKMSAPSILASRNAYIIYGTAWKKDDTARLVTEAIESGFRFFDTACQPKHYNEGGVGDGIAASKKLGINRSDLYLQTKFTPHKKGLTADEERLIPYDILAELEDQVKQAFENSLEHLKTAYLDAILVHMKTMEDTIRVWRVFEALYDEGKVLYLGVSNMYEVSELQELYNTARIKPTLIQNRFHSKTKFDSQIREFCNSHKITYQSFWTLTANRHALATSEISNLANQKNLTPQTLMYAFMMALGHTPLDGTTNKAHMMEDVAVMKRVLHGEDILSESEINFMARVIGL